jgi:thiol-disulfide isomerase/thioredoxin
VVLVNFWATWCEPCKVEIPWMIEFQQKYSPQGFTILGVSMDEDGKKAIQPFLDKERFDVNGQKEAMSYPILLGSDTIAEKFWAESWACPPACFSHARRQEGQDHRRPGQSRRYFQGHQQLTAACSGISSPSASRSSMCKRIASLMFVTASSNVSPWL